MAESGEMGMFDVVVVGAGIMGSCAAYEVAKRGRTVALLEQFDFLHQLGSSHGESRTIRATYSEAYYTSMVQKSRVLWEQAQEEAGYRVHTPAPHFDVGPSDSRTLQRLIANCESSSIPFRVLGPANVAEAFSGVFTLPEGWVGVETEFGGVIRPTKAVAMFQSLAMRRGAVLKDRVRVTGNCVSNGAHFVTLFSVRFLKLCGKHSSIAGISKDKAHDFIHVSAADGTSFRCTKCIVTAGAWMKKIIESVAGKVVPGEPIQVNVCYWKIKEPHAKLFTPETGFPTFASYGEPCLYGTPSLEFPGLVKIALHGGRRCDPDLRDWETDVILLQRRTRPWIEQVMSRYVEAEKPVATQSCMYSMMPDGDFVIDYVGGEFGRDLVVAGGFSGHGFKMGPLVGSMVAGMVVGDRVDGVELDHFRLDRFVDNPMGNAKDDDHPFLSQALL